MFAKFLRELISVRIHAAPVFARARARMQEKYLANYLCIGFMLGSTSENDAVIRECLREQSKYVVAIFDWAGLIDLCRNACLFCANRFLFARGLFLVSRCRFNSLGIMSLCSCSYA